MQTANPNVLALDYGERRVGVAVASTIARLPRPLPALPQNPEFWQQLTKLVSQEGIAAIVIGLPRGLNGQETAQTSLARAFAAEVEQKVAMPVHLQDEAVTSAQAEAELKARGKSFDKGMIDSLAAVYILEDYLQSTGVRHG
jgi:putative holliday junction resolvase